MIGTYLEIIIMLLGAFLLGMFVAWQYWRKKYQGLHESYEKLDKDTSQTIKELELKVEKLESEARKKDKSIDDANRKAEVLRKEIGVLDKELTAAHDTLIASKKKPKQSSYYKYIDGKRYKAATLREADEAISGKGDGRISEEDSRKIFDTISDGHQYTPTEKATIRYLRENYKWTDKADHLFRHLVGSWAAHDHNVDEINE